MKQISIHSALVGHLRSRQVIEAMTVDLIRTTDARGRLPCAVATCSALNILLPNPTKDAVARLRRQHPGVIRACVEFLMRPRTGEQHRALRYDQGRCDCALTTSLVAQLHRPKEYGVCIESPEGLETVFGRIFDLFVVCARASTANAGTARITKQLRRAQDLENRQKLASWPASYADIAPYGAEASLKALCAWIPYFPGAKLLVYIDHVCHILDLPQVYPHLFAGTVITEALIPTLGYLLAQWPSLRENHNTCNEYARALSRVSQLLSRFACIDREYLADVVRGTSFDWGMLLENLDLACETLMEVDMALQNGRPLAIDSTYVHRIASSFTVYGGRLYAALGYPMDRRLDDPDIYRDNAETFFANLRAKPPVALAEWHWYLYGGQICGSPGCRSTAVSVGRRLSACKGCHHVFYCSRECQRRAWKHPELAHKAVCLTLGSLMKGVDRKYAAGQTQEQFRDEYVKELHGHDEATVGIIEHLRELYRR